MKDARWHQKGWKGKAGEKLTMFWALLLEVEKQRPRKIVHAWLWMLFAENSAEEGTVGGVEGKDVSLSKL